MKFDASFRLPMLPLALASLTACSAGSAIIGGQDAGADTAVNDLGAVDVPVSPPDAASPDAPPADAPVEPRRAWTIFVYGHADHSLSHALETDINEMSEATFGQDVNVIVMADYDATKLVAGPRAGTMSAAYPVFSAADRMANRPFPSGTTWYRVRSHMTPEVIGTEPEKDMDDPRNLSAAIDEAFRRFPAERYGLVLWDHGGAWDGGYGGDEQDGTRNGMIQPDGGVRPGPTPMAPVVAANAVRAGLMARGLTGARPLEFVSFDTCLMGTAEVIREFEPLTKVYFGAAEIDYGDGWDYNATLSYIAANLTAPMTGIAMQEVAHWNAHHSMGQLDRLLRSHVAVDMAGVAPFTEATRAFTTAVMAGDAAARARVARHGYFSVPGYHIEANALAQTSESTPRYRDMGQFLSLVQADAMLPMAIRDAARTAGQRFDTATLGVAESDLRRGANQGGIQVALPTPDFFTPAVANLYATNVPAWQMQTGWSDMIRSLQATATTTPTSVTSTAINLNSPTAATRPAVTVTPRGDVTELAVALGSVSSTSSVDALEFLGRQQATDNTPITVAWDGLLTVVSGLPRTMLPAADAAVPALQSQAVTVLPVLPSTASTPTVDQPAIVGIPGALIDGNTRVVAILLCADSGGRMLTPVAFNVIPPRIIALQDTIGLEFAPARMVFTEAGDGGTATRSFRFGTPVVIGAGIFNVGSVPAPMGAYVLLPQVNDVYGRDASATAHPVAVTAPFAM